MKKNTIRWWIILVAVLAVYNVVVFAVPFPKNAVFFVSWAFTLLAIGAQAYVIRTAFYQSRDIKSRFYGFPIAKVGGIYLIIQIVLGVAFMTLGLAISVPIWVPLVLYMVLLGASAVGFVAAETTRDEVERQDAKLKKDVSCMRALESKAAAMVPLAKDDQMRKSLEVFAENLRFSDPVSSEALNAIEADLTAYADELQQAMVENDTENALTLVKKAQTVLAERNRLCKLEK